MKKKIMATLLMLTLATSASMVAYAETPANTKNSAVRSVSAQNQGNSKVISFRDMGVNFSAEGAWNSAYSNLKTETVNWQKLFGNDSNTFATIGFKFVTDEGLKKDKDTVAPYRAVPAKQENSPGAAPAIVDPEVRELFGIMIYNNNKVPAESKIKQDFHYQSLKKIGEQNNKVYYMGWNAPDNAKLSKTSMAKYDQLYREMTSTAFTSKIKLFRTPMK